MAKALTGDDVEDALRLIEENGGGGAFELPGDETEAVERYMYPRFHGATDDADFYLSRIGVGGHDTDVESVIAMLNAPRNIVGGVLLLSEPGTGKTALIEAAVTHMGTKKKPRLLTTVLCTPDHTQEKLFKVFVGEGKGDCVNHEHQPNKECEAGCVRAPFMLGPIPYAAKYGHVLYLDEVMRLEDGVVPILYPLADGRHELPEGNVDGTALEIHPDFRLVMSSNPMVRGASLPEPIASRCASTTITVETDAALLYDMGIDESIVECWSTLKEQGTFAPQIRELRVANYWLSIDITQAASALIPEHCPESERETVRNTVLSFLGGDLRADGRLVVR